MILSILIVVSILLGADAFGSIRKFNQFRNSNLVVAARRSNTFGVDFGESTPYVVGVDVPEEIMKSNAIYDMILVERYSAPEKTSAGIFLPKVEGKDQKTLGKVLSVPSDYGLESENGRLQPISEIAPYKKGDVVFIRVSFIALVF
jgi:co-chaperonin GroES (HSP10)